MPLPSLVEYEAFETWSQRPVANRPRAEAILSAASTLIRAHTGRVWVDDDGTEDGVTEVQLGSVENVVLTVASRVYFNPDGNESQATGPFSRKVADWQALGLDLSDAEKEQLTGTPTPGIPGLWSLRVIAPAAARGTRYTIEWWEDNPDTEIGEGDTGS